MYLWDIAVIHILCCCYTKQNVILLQGTVVYVNFGRDSDFRYLETLSVNIKGSILLVRLGKESPVDIVSYNIKIMNIRYLFVYDIRFFWAFLVLQLVTEQIIKAYYWAISLASQIHFYTWQNI